MKKDYLLTVLILEGFLAGHITKENAQELGRALNLKGFGK